jgi:hypothetical protein
MYFTKLNCIKQCAVIPISLSIATAFAQDRSRYMHPCLTVIPNKTVTLSVRVDSPEFSYDKSTSEITAISETWGNDPEKLNYSKRSHSHGFTATEILISVESNAQGLYLDPNRKPLSDAENPKLMCFKAGVNIRLSFERFIIYVAKDFRDNQCIYDGIKRHELMHASLYQDNIRKLSEEIKLYAESKTNGKIFFVENSKLFDGKSLAADIADFGKKRWAEMKGTHKSIDENDKFDTLKKECKS